MRRVLFALAVLALVPTPAWAHPGHGSPSFGAGVAHPLSGIDHLLAILAVGLWTGQVGGRARWILPVAFVLPMGLGGWLGFAGVQLPGVEAGIAASVLVLGLLVATAARWRVPAAAALIAGFALLHGHAHGTEASAASSGYALGFLTATIALLAVGVGLAVLARSSGRSVLIRLGGAGIAVAGILIALG